MSIDSGIVFHALESVLSFFFIGCLGYYLARRNWFTPESIFMLSRLITQVALPLYLVYNINTVLTKSEIISLGYGLVVPFSSVILILVYAIVMAKVMKVAPTRRGIFITSFTFSNTIYIGLPVNLALFGTEALPFVLLYYFANTTLFWTVGMYYLATDSEGGGAAPKKFGMETVKRILSPPIFGFIFALILMAFDLKLPTAIANTARYLGNLTTPLVILTIGVTLYNMGLKSIRFDAQLIMILIARFILSPLAVVVLSWYFPLPDLMRKVFIIQSSLPIMSSVAMLAKYYKSDADFAAVAVSTTTLFSLFTIPFFMVVGTVLTQ